MRVHVRQVDLLCKVRHGPQFYRCDVEKLDDDCSKVRVYLPEDDQGLAPGQFAVFYREDECLGCGIIQQSEQQAASALLTSNSEKGATHSEPVAEAGQTASN